MTAVCPLCHLEYHKSPPSIPHITLHFIPPHSLLPHLHPHNVSSLSDIVSCNFRFRYQPTTMKFPLSLLGILQISHALHISPGARSAKTNEIRHTTQNSNSNGFTGPLAAYVADTQDPKKPIPWWKFPNTDNGEMNALTGQQFGPFDDDDDGTEETSTNTNAVGLCPLNQCHSNGVIGKTSCGPHARCIESYCQCNLGWKPTSDMQMVRGWTGLEALTVWTDVTDTGCAARCDTLSCSEVPQVKACFGGPTTSADSDNGNDQLATDNLHLGAIKAPGADIGQDFEADAAVTGAGRAT